MSAFPVSEAIAITRVLIGVSTLIWVAEYAVLSPQLTDSRLLSWDVGRLRYRATSLGRFEAPGWALFGAAGAASLLALRALAALMMLAPFFNAEWAPPVWGLTGAALIALTTLLWSMRCPQGQDGSDQVMFWLCCSLVIGYAVNTPVTWALVTLFVVAQLNICYLTAGVTKLMSQEWRSGVAAPYVFRTYTYGNGAVYRRIAGSRRAQLLIAWFVIGFEILFPIIFFVPPGLGQYLLLVPLSFHLASALFMGLNLFFLNFLAAYPFALTFVWADFSSVDSFLKSFVV